MPPAQQSSSFAGSLRMFQVAGISVYLHWSWLVVAVIELRARTNVYTSQVWNVAEYLSLFVIVLLHEFGHALACRQVGGKANEVVLWPLGGIAFVRPPARPGAVLWSIAAGPLVNVLLAPVTLGAFYFAREQGLGDTNRDALQFLFDVARMNLGLLILNMLPIFPLDGGQILQAILWFIIGPIKSLMAVSIIAIPAALVIVAWAVWDQSIWIGILAFFVATRAWDGIMRARLMAQVARNPQRQDAVCPSCRTHPLTGEFWTCAHCGTRFDTFAHRAVCPGCSSVFAETECPVCLKQHPITEWFTAVQEPTNPELRSDRPHGEE
jgi:Zn-dependent protease